jgi:hypothetical protein
MIKRLGRVLVVAGGLVGAGQAVPSAARAQGRIELTPFVGNYYPLLTMSDDFGGKNPPNLLTDWKAQQLDAVAFGGRLTFWVTNTIGIEAAGSYNGSDPKLTSPDDSSSFFFKGNLITASGRLLYRPARLNLHFILGGGIVKRGGEAWEGGEQLTKPAGVAGISVRAAVSPKFALNVSAEINVHAFDVDGSRSAVNSSKMQADLLVSIGVPITLSR